jgi:Gram-negative bacterial TonB protein C-terminal
VTNLQVEAERWDSYACAGRLFRTPPTVSDSGAFHRPARRGPRLCALLDLVISASGEVESVRLRTSSPDIRTSMMLSAFKAWRFDPARRNGRPVRYRYLVKLTSQ